MADFLPRGDEDRVLFTANFAKQITADPARFGLTAAQAAAYQTVQSAFAQAYRAAVSPQSRGLATVRMKNERRKAAVAMTRELTRIVRASPGVTSVDLLMLGLRARGAAVRGAGEPAPPRVMVRADSRRVEVLLRRDDLGRARPAGTAGAAVYWATGEVAPTRLDDFKLAGNTTQTRMAFVLPGEAGEPGTKVWVTARWLDARLRPGKANPPVSVRVGYGFLLAAA